MALAAPIDAANFHSTTITAKTATASRMGARFFIGACEWSPNDERDPPPATTASPEPRAPRRLDRRNGSGKIACSRQRPQDLQASARGMSALRDECLACHRTSASPASGNHPFRCSRSDPERGPSGLWLPSMAWSAFRLSLLSNDERDPPPATTANPEPRGPRRLDRRNGSPHSSLASM